MSLLRVVGFTLLFGGVGCVLGAMTVCTTTKIVLLRGSFQRPDEYTKTGWRLYRAGLAAFVLGLLVSLLTAR